MYKVCVQTHIYLGVRFFLLLPGALPLHAHTSSCPLEIWMMLRDSHSPIPIFDCLHKHTYTSWCVPLSHLQERFPYTNASLHTTCILISTVWDESS